MLDTAYGPSSESFPCVCAPPSHADRVISLAMRHPDHGDGAHDLHVRKSYRLTDANTWDEASTIYGTAHSAAEVWLDDLPDWAGLLNILAKRPATAITLGRLGNTERREHDFGRWTVESRAGAYEDVPTRWLLLDLDDIAGDVGDAQSAVADFIAEHVPELEFCAHVIAHTASSGIKGLRLRVVFELDAPRTLAACKAFVDFVNTRAGHTVLDATIYAPGHLIFTSAPYLYTVQGGALVNVPRPIMGRIAWHVPGDLASIPDALPVAGATGILADSGFRLSRAGAAVLIASMGEGNYNTAIHRVVCHAAYTHTSEDRDTVLAGLAAQFEERIRATSDPAKLEKRLRGHLNVARLRRKWDGAVARKLAAAPLITAAPVAATPPTPQPPAPTTVQDALALAALPLAASPDAPLAIEEVRAELAAMYAVDHRDIVRGVRKHVLYRHAPGTGKSHAQRMPVDLAALYGDLTVDYAPNHRLAAEKCAEMQAHARTLTEKGDGWHYGIDLASRARHHKGRSQPGMCPDSVFKAIADRAEALGINVKAAACDRCPTGKAGTCPTLLQESDNGPGIIHKAAARAVHDNPDDGRSLSVFDEDPLGAAVTSATVTLDAIEARVTIRRRDNRVTLRKKTLALESYRDTLAAALQGSTPVEQAQPGTLPLAPFMPLLSPASFTRKRGRRVETATLTELDKWAALEVELRESIHAEVENALKLGRPVDRFNELGEASKRVSQIIEALRASLGVPNREYVFGIAVYWQAVQSKRVVTAKVCTKDSRFSKLVAGGSVTLDGTADPAVWSALVGSSVPRIVRNRPVAVRPGAARVMAYTDDTGSRSSLLGGVTDDDVRAWQEAGMSESELTTHRFEKAEKQERKRRADSRLSLIWRFALERSAVHEPRAVTLEDGRRVSVLVICQEAIEQRLKTLGLPDTVAVEHFGNIRGLNTYRRVPCAMVVGRMRPANIDIELTAEALWSDDQTVPAIARYHVDPAQGRPWREDHPDHRCAAVLRHTTLAEVQQAAARLRIFDRTPDDPCELHVFGRYDCGFEVDSYRQWVEGHRDWADIALARGAIFSDPHINRAVYRDLMPCGAASGGHQNAAVRRRWAETLQTWVIGTSSMCISNSCLSPISKIEAQSGDHLLRLRHEFDMQAQLCLVGFNLAGGYRKFALVKRGTSEADLATLLRQPVRAMCVLTDAEATAYVARETRSLSGGNHVE